MADDQTKEILAQVKLQFDALGKPKINKPELEDLFVTLGFEVANNFEEHFSNMDSDCDGLVDFKDF